MTNQDIFHLNLALAKRTDFGKIEQPTTGITKSQYEQLLAQVEQAEALVKQAKEPQIDYQAKLMKDCKAYMLAKSSVIDAIYPSMKQEEFPSALPKSVVNSINPVQIDNSKDFNKQQPKQNTEYNPLDIQKEILKQFSLAESIAKIKADENIRISNASFGDRFFYRRGSDGEYMTNIGSPAEHIHQKISVAQYQHWKTLGDTFYEYRESLINQAQAWFHSVNNTAPPVKGNTTNEKWF